ncbi:MAG: Gfo/Idh/MocA family oxidoreductase [Candidatus Margulisbacteria bacterium]|nr:Gfo/Idh/MocA family oxidoreductase [Candidatus Margulisiibacteriota bacterium]MBU1021514.1 Gfo/Idh/MocA family oxidoreductase [Candidatus Margulisiibacteriota bacterium]MBU1728599.1 Gfo/Idh/MocA family oxidoreductase [Candidatus Margulisiibacteriota bacterium]MBU1955822.1 Gfo/Idh/MocA family oxidoreductase [Candidatus Margulisiibacteriota bacterium]
MKFLIVGCGSIGQRHLRNLISLGHEVFGCEINPQLAEQIQKKHGINVFKSLEEALTQRYDGALICSPTSLHVPIAIKLAQKGINLFIEKPLSNNLDDIDKLENIVNKQNLVVLVGCNTRFFPSFKLAKELIEKNKIGKVLSVKIECGFYLPYWHPYEDYRKGYSANRKLGGGVIFDDIHEIDSLLWLFGDVKELFCLADRVSSLEIDTEDIAEILLRFKSKVIAQVHLDYLQRTYRRYYEFIGENGIIIWDYIKQSVQLYSKKVNQWQTYQESINVNRESMFIDEIKHFIDCLKGKATSINDLACAKKILKVALACHASAQRKEMVSL